LRRARRQHLLVGGVERGRRRRGGAITVTARQVEISAGSIDASGDTGGGLIRLGGDYQGKGSIPNSRTLLVDRLSRIRANARRSGDGGRVICGQTRTRSSSERFPRAAASFRAMAGSLKFRVSSCWNSPGTSICSRRAGLRGCCC